MEDAMNLKSIKNYRAVNDRISTGGQPTSEQLVEIADAGVTRIVNIATENKEGFDEALLANELGITYSYIPVDWSEPTDEDLTRFMDVLDDAKDERVFIHCAANYRAIAFYALYGSVRLGWDSDTVDAFIVETWNPDKYPVWRSFIDKIVGRG